MELVSEREKGVVGEGEGGSRRGREKGGASP